MYTSDKLLSAAYKAADGFSSLSNSEGV